MYEERRSLIAAVVVVCLLSVSVYGKYGGGSGTAEDPYQIWTAEEMQAIGAEPNDWDRHFKLMADIDLSAFGADEFNIIGTAIYDYYDEWHCRLQALHSHGFMFSVVLLVVAGGAVA